MVQLSSIKTSLLGSCSWRSQNFIAFQWLSIAPKLKEFWFCMISRCLFLYRFITKRRTWRSLFFKPFSSLVEMIIVAESLFTSHSVVLNKSHGLICRINLNSFNFFKNGLYQELYKYYPTQSTSTHLNQITLLYLHVLCPNLLIHCPSVVYQTK